MNFINKTKSYSLLLLGGSLLAIYSCSTSETQTVTTLNNLVLSEEFDRTSATDSLPNPKIWSYNEGRGSDGWGNNELQYYTDRPENVVLKDGMLVITANQESYMGAGYTSGRILTKDSLSIKYGRIEARVKLPWGKGLWPAFWMLGTDIDTVGWPQCGEIDIMEYLGDNPTTAFGSVHGPGYFGGTAITKEYTLEGERFDTGFHIFGVEWGENYINYYIDDVLYNQITPADVTGEWVFNKPFFIILNVAVGGNFPGSPTAETVFPQKMLVDYVKIYQ